jgi:predicted RNA polymerase sigma factor
VDANAALEKFLREESGRLVGSLTRQLGNFDLAEESVQEAILEALSQWPISGVPEEPGAWLRVTARRKAIDRIRRAARFSDRLQVLGKQADTEGGSSDLSGVVDDRLVLLFMCCHPTLSREAQVALTLRSLLGMTTAQLAKAFLTSEATMTKRIVRAKRKIVEAGIPFAIPGAADVRGRFSEVVASIYVMFNEGYLSAGPDRAEREELAGDAEWLAGLLMQLLPGDPEVIGLVALIKLHQARREARFDAEDQLVLLGDQDRSRWDRKAINEAIELLTTALKMGLPGFYQAQAAIAGCHAVAERWEDTNWDLIVTLYDQLLTIADTPVAALNRAIAVQHRDGPEAGLTELDPLAGRLDSYHLFHAARAQMLRRLGRSTEAAREDRVAVELTSNPAERSLLRRRIDDALVVLDGRAR